MNYLSTYSTAGIRPDNEDSLYPLAGTTQSQIFIVADGLGGHEDGKLASHLACEIVSGILTNENPLDFVVGGYRMNTEELYLSFLGDAVRQARDNVIEKAAQLQSSMATTLLVLYLHEGRGYVAQVGDCALFAGGAGEMPPVKKTQEHRRGKGLTNVLGKQDGGSGTPDLFSFEFTPDSVVVMGSDGFWEAVTPAQIGEIVESWPPFAAAEVLARAALAAESMDNVSVIVVAGEGFVEKYAHSQIEHFRTHQDSIAFENRDGMLQALEDFERSLLPAPEPPAAAVTEFIFEASTIRPLVSEQTLVRADDHHEALAIEQKELKNQIEALQSEVQDLREQIQKLQRSNQGLQQDLYLKDQDVRKFNLEVPEMEAEIAELRLFLRGMATDLRALHRKYPAEVEEVLTREHMEMLNEAMRQRGLLTHSGNSTRSNSANSNSAR